VEPRSDSFFVSQNVRFPLYMKPRSHYFLVPQSGVRFWSLAEVFFFCFFLCFSFLFFYFPRIHQVPVVPSSDSSLVSQTSVRFACITGVSCHKCHFCRDKHKALLCRDKSMLAATTLLSRQDYVCRDKIFLLRQFVSTKYVFCCDKYMFAVTKVSLSRQNIFVATKLLFCRDKHAFCRHKNDTCGSSRQRYAWSLALSPVVFVLLSPSVSPGPWVFFRRVSACGT